MYSQTYRLYEKYIHKKVWRYGTITLCGSAFQHISFHTSCCVKFQTLHIRHICVRLLYEQVPFHSQLLRISWLVSFPALIDMLKFRGLTHLSWGNKIFKKKFFKIFKKFEKVWSRPHSQKDSKIPSSLYYHRDQILFKNFKYFEYLGKRLSCPKHKPNFPTPQKIFWHYNSASVTFVSLAKCMFFWQVYVFLYVTVFWE